MPSHIFKQPELNTVTLADFRCLLSCMKMIISFQRAEEEEEDQRLSVQRGRGGRGSWQRLKTAGNKNPSGFKNRTKTLFTFLHDEEEKNNFHYFVSSCFMSLWKDHSAFTSSQLLLPPSYNCDVTANCSESVSVFQELLQIQPTQTSFKVCLIVSDLCLIVWKKVCKV